MTSPTSSGTSSTPSVDPALTEDYCLEVESHFAERRGTPFLFSAKDWYVLQEWRESAIPLAIVLEAIDQCFEKREKAGRHRTVSSLRYCRHAVKQLWEERKQLLVGAGAEVPEIDPQKQLAELASRLQESAAAAGSVNVQAVLGETARRIGDLGQGLSLPRIEEELLSIEQNLIDQISGALSSEELSDLMQSVDGELSAYAATTNAAVLEKTRQANLRRLLRKRLSLPRLSLFG